MKVPVHGSDAFIEGFGRNEKVRWHEYTLVIQGGSTNLDKSSFWPQRIYGYGGLSRSTFSSRPVRR